MPKHGQNLRIILQKSVLHVYSGRSLVLAQCGRRERRQTLITQKCPRCEVLGLTKQDESWTQTS